MNPQDSTPENNAGGELPSQQQSAEQQTSNTQQPESGQTQVTQNNDAPSQTTTDDQQPTQSNDATQNSGDELDKWASSQNIDLNNPTPEQARMLAKRLRDTQRWASERAANNQQFDQVQNNLADENEDPVEKELREIKNQNARRDFWDANPDDRGLEKDMISQVQKMIDEGDIDGARYYSSPKGWAGLLKIVKAEKANDIKDEAYETGRQTERENLARAQQASPPVSAASSSAPPKPFSDADVAKMTMAEYEAWRKSNNPFRA